LAADWVGGAAEVSLWEFELGYVAWRTAPPRPAGSIGPPSMVGTPMAVVDKQTGRLSVWPSLSPQLVAERYRQEHAAQQRFPEQVRRVLVEAGWQPGRDVTARVQRWLESEVYAPDPALRDRLPLFPAARAALAEFGGLRFTQLKRIGHATGGFRVEIWPDVGPVPVQLCQSCADDFGVRVFPFAWYEDGSTTVVIDERGRVYLLGHAEEYLLGATVDEALANLVGPGRWPSVDDHGNLIMPRVQRRVDLTYRLVRGDLQVSPGTQAKTWFFDIPTARDTGERWAELLSRIFYDANVRLQRNEPGDLGWFMLDRRSVTPVDPARMLAWDGSRNRESLTAYLPFLESAARVIWEGAGCWIVDDAGRYDGMEGEDFAELVLYRTHDAGQLGADAAVTFLDRLYPGHGAACWTSRQQRLANLDAVRPTAQFRSPPDTQPASCGPPRPEDVDHGPEMR
jgi:hypothetical protein